MNDRSVSVVSAGRRLAQGIGVSVVLGSVPYADAAELKPETVAAFNRYVEATEARMQRELSGEAPFLWVDRLPATDRDSALERLAAGEIVIEALETRNNDREIDIPSGMVHHWVGTVLLPDITLEQTLAMVRDYDRYPEIYAPDVREARVIAQTGHRFHVFFQFYTKKVITWVANAEFDVEFSRLDDRRAHVPSYSRRIQEIEHPFTPEARERPEGNDRGAAWRMYNYCSFEERGDDTYMQCENITLSRGLSFPLNIIIRPFVTGVPREKLSATLAGARRHLTAQVSE